MSHWTFVALAYGVTVAAMVALALLSWRAMRRAEAAAESLTRR
jgi:heme exporter protein CcmD